MDLLFTSNYFGWVSEVARRFDAEKHVTGISGIGVLDGDDLYGIGEYVHNRNPFGNDEWDYEEFSPDAVIMLIGPNDDSSDSDFVPSYLNLMKSIYNKYKDAGSNP